MSDLGGRPTVLTNECVQKLEDAFKAGFNVSEACYIAGISRATYYEHTAANEAFSDRMAHAKAWVSLRAKHAVVTAIDKGDLGAAKWWLERKARNEFGANAIEDEDVWRQQTKTNEVDPLSIMLKDMKASAGRAIERVTSIK